MADYEVTLDGATLHHFVADSYDSNGNKTDMEEIRSVIHAAGDVVSDTGEGRLATHVVTAYEAGDEHIHSLLSKKGATRTKKEEE